MIPSTLRVAALLLFAAAAATAAEPKYDLLLRGGHLIDPKNGVDAVRELARICPVPDPHWRVIRR